jgi:hypothetical protein
MDDRLLASTNDLQLLSIIERGAGMRRCWVFSTRRSVRFGESELSAHVNLL